MADQRLRIIVTGLAGLYPVGGVAWDYLQYVIGFARLNHDIYYHEDSWSWPYHPVMKTYTREGDYSAGYIDAFFKRYAPDLRDRWHYFHLHEESFGMSGAAFDEVAQTADLFINVSGACMIPENLSPRCIKIFMDTDPGYNQIMMSERFDWSENVDRWCDTIALHDQHFTFAENMYGEDCLLPRLNYRWKTTRMPIVTDLWWGENGKPAPLAPSGSPWTTIMTWNNFKGRLVYNGVEYFSKGTEFERIMDLPRRVGAPLKVAVGGVNAPLDRIGEAGWEAVDGPENTVTPEMYKDFILASRGEISTAKQVYVAMKTGWYSCRSASYLAAGRPVVVQDTGFSRIIPSADGMIAFTTVEGAAEAIRRIEEDYPRHAAGALAVADEYFESGKVLTRFVDDVYRTDETGA